MLTVFKEHLELEQYNPKALVNSLIVYNEEIWITLSDRGVGVSARIFETMAVNPIFEFILEYEKYV